MTEVLLTLLVIAALLWFLVARWLGGADMRRWDAGDGREQRFASDDEGGAEQRAVLEAIGRLLADIKGVPFSRRLAQMRLAMDALTHGRDFGETRFCPVDAGGVPAEWVLAPGADPARRTLYIHGGAYTAGSPRSHRSITARFAEITGGAVLAIDYRLMPEHSRRAGIDDCRSAYRWILAHGPDGASPATAVFVAGDSAGGNLTLSLIAWVRDAGLRAPDAAVALSPSTDSTLGSPSLKANLATDPMLGPVFGYLARIPRSALLFGAWLSSRVRPSDPLVSPLIGELSGLPPLLIQASQNEMLIDDARRYVHKAAAAGSPVRLQTWAHMVHVWQIFDPALPQARQAFDEIRKFIEAAAPVGGAVRTRTDDGTAMEPGSRGDSRAAGHGTAQSGIA
ncbi:MAG: alpha/beta hydrolase [Burkholderiaceae bacterium]|nr:alpha/beta hydrolase [Burkholderiaceae bacterium]